MIATKQIRLLHGKEGLTLRVPASATVLESAQVPALPDTAAAVRDALANPIGTPPLRELLAARQARTAAITISDITRPVPNRQFLPAILKELNEAGIDDSSIVIVVGTGMHRPSTEVERRALVGGDILARVDVIDHRADDPATLVKISDEPPVSICRRFVAADFRIVTGYIEPHFMAGFSGGRKGVCPALVDLPTIQRFHGYDTLCEPAADNGLLEGNPCHRIAMKVAQAVGVDFLFNVALTRSREIAGIYCGDLEQAHLAGCRDVAKWSAAHVEEPYDLVITNGGGYPLDQTFYQTVKGMCTALPALHAGSTLLQVSQCAEQIGSPAYAELMLTYDNNWGRFLADIAACSHQTHLDQWQFQMHTRVLERIGVKKLRFVSDGIPPELQKRLSVTPVLGDGDAPTRAHRAIDDFVAAHGDARIAVIPDGPYTLLQR